MNRKLASIKRITNIEPIENADKIEKASIGGWNVVVAKDVGHKVGDLVIYCEIDSFLPIRDEFEFLRKSSYRKLPNDTEGFVLRTMKLRGVISQGLILPLEILINTKFKKIESIEEGLDVTDILGITKYEPPIPPEIAGEVEGAFPPYLKKTDEERVQNLDDDYESLKNESWYLTEKLDGTSCTYLYDGEKFGVCGRNYEYKYNETNSLWRFALENEIPSKLEKIFKEEGNMVCLQGELIGNKIQKNRYKLINQEFRMFNVIFFNKEGYFEYLDSNHLEEYARILGIKTVPVLDKKFKLPDSIDELLKYAEGKSVLNENTEREGIVIRTEDKSKSFKVISNKFLIKNNE